MSVAEKLLTIEEYNQHEYPYTELVRGRIVDVNPPGMPHGYVAGNISGVYRQHVRQHHLGRVFANDTGVVTEREPDTVRGADVMYYSYDRLPEGPLPDGYADTAPELVFEVFSPGDRWSMAFEKAAEYLKAGVLVVCIVDPKTQRVQVCRDEQEPQTFTTADQLTLPEIFGDFAVPVREFFE